MKKQTDGSDKDEIDFELREKVAELTKQNMDAEHYSALLYDKLLKANRERETLRQELSEAKKETADYDALLDFDGKRWLGDRWDMQYGGNSYARAAVAFVRLKDAEAELARHKGPCFVDQKESLADAENAALRAELAEAKKREIAHTKAVGESSAVLLRERDEARAEAARADERIRSLNIDAKVNAVARADMATEVERLKCVNEGLRLHLVDSEAIQESIRVLTGVISSVREIVAEAVKASDPVEFSDDSVLMKVWMALAPAPTNIKSEPCSRDAVGWCSTHTRQSDECGPVNAAPARKPKCLCIGEMYCSVCRKP